jgi:phosphoribosyl 1,2-cyclic phosphodiesterase
MRVTSLGSGSSGNALLVEAGPQRRTKLLVDAGFSGRILCQRLQQAGVAPAQLQGICITHEHTDHVAGLPWLAKRYSVPVIADTRTLAAVEQQLSSGYAYTESGTFISLQSSYRTDESDGVFYAYNGGFRTGEQDTRLERLPLDAGSRRTVGDIEVTSFPVSHDAVAPCGYLLSAGGCRVCIITDSGEVTDAMLAAISHADLLIIESNHDRERLLRGPYPQTLKQRILSASGHLSNDQAADAILRTWRTDSVRWLWLSHLSRTNNTPKLAFTHLRQRIAAAKANLSQVHITVLPPTMGSTWDSTQLWENLALWQM